MHNTFRRLLITCLAVLLLIPLSVPVHADEERDGTITIHSQFYVLTTQKNRTMEVRFNPNWFKKRASAYSHDLAKASLGLATSAFRPKQSQTEDISSADMNLNHFLTEAGFSDLRSDDYDKDPNMYTVSTVLGHQKIGKDDEAFELIAVGVCGQGYIDEWESNFSIGDGDVHDGFSRSSQLIFDRIFGYIASEHLHGPFKVWISGFSRAAAISNLTAKRLVDSNMFDEDTVFAYTFATPRTARNVDIGNYTNIFNIVGKTDPVPNVPFADWGYDRYGITLYTPCQQTDSNFAEKRIKANEVYKKLTGIDYWVNPDAEAMSRILLAYCLKLCPSADIYANSLQEKLIHIWEDRSPLNILSSFLDMANDPVLINEANRTEANGLMDYLTLLLVDFLDEESIYKRWNDTASMGANLLQAHTPELYVSWVFSTDSARDLYTQSNSYRMVYVQNADELNLVRDNTIIETITRKKDEKENTGEESLPDQNIYLGQTEDMLTAMIPGDYEYSLYLEPQEDTQVRMFELDYILGRQSSSKTVQYSFDIRKGDNLAITYTTDGKTFYSKNETEKQDQVYMEEMNLDQSAAIRFVRRTMKNMSWRDVVIMILSIVIVFVCLIIFQLLYIVGKIRFRHRVKKGWVPKGTKYRFFPFLCVCNIFLLFLIMQFASALFPEYPILISTFKAVIGAVSILLAVHGLLRRKDRLTGLILVSMIIFTTADILINESIYIGPLLHIAAYLVLTYAFIRQERPGKRQIFLFIVLCAAAIFNLSQVSGDYGWLRIIAMIYVITASAMVTASLTMPRRTFAGTGLLYLSGVLLILNYINGTTFTSHFISLGVYYVGIALLASTGTQTRLLHLVPLAEPSSSDEPPSEPPAGPPADPPADEPPSGDEPPVPDSDPPLPQEA